METTLVICCDCDEHVAIENARKIKLNGLTQDFYICNQCIKDVPLVLNVVETVESRELKVENTLPPQDLDSSSIKISA